jgi:hypothetical protein
MPLTLSNSSGNGNFTLANTTGNGNLAFSIATTVVTSGLEVYLDTSNASSYPGTGTTWTDLSGNGNNATLINTPTYNSNFGGYLNFSATSLEYATIPDIGDLNTWTVEAWFRLTSSLSGKVTAIVCNQFNLVNKLNYSIGTNSAPSSYNLAAGFYNGAWRTTTGISASTGVWYQVVGTYNGSIIRQYINGNASGGTLTYTGTPQSGGQIRLMRRWDEALTAGNFVNGDLSIVRIYNTALTDAQILQNFNADKSKYSL